MAGLAAALQVDIGEEPGLGRQTVAALHFAGGEVMAEAFKQALVAVAILAVLPFVPMGDEPVTRVTFIAIFSFIALSTAVNGVAWNTWMQGAVPLRVRGKFFGRRNRLLYISLLAFLFAAIIRVAQGSATVAMITGATATAAAVATGVNTTGPTGCTAAGNKTATSAAGTSHHAA